ncbi:hypothetical protein LXL04_032291 [Taraxacum kok-saghyz]
MFDHSPQLLQKPESTTNAAMPVQILKTTERIRRVYERLRGHLDDCLSFASCSSPHGDDDESETGDQLVRRRRRSDLEGDDLATPTIGRTGKPN